MLLYFFEFILFTTTIFSITHFVNRSIELGFSEVLNFNRCLASLLISVFVAAWGLKRKSLDKSGALLGIFVGTVITLGSYCFTACLLVFFYTSSKLTHLESEKKKQIEADYKVGGQRNWLQVFCNGCTAAECSLLYIYYHGVGESAINFRDDYVGSWLSVAVLAALAGSNGDTWASEIGTIVTRKEPRLITSFQKVPVGTNGGVTVLGVCVSAIGGMVVGVGYFVTLYMCSQKASVHQAVLLLSIGAFSGLFGSIIDSVLGATLQYSGLDMTTGKIVQKPGPYVKHICGRPLLSNDSVNMCMSFINAILVPTLTSTFCIYFVC